MQRCLSGGKNYRIRCPVNGNWRHISAAGIRLSYSMVYNAYMCCSQVTPVKWYLCRQYVHGIMVWHTVILFGGSAHHQFELIVRDCRRLFCLRGAFTLRKQPSLTAIVTISSVIQSIWYLFEHPAVTWPSDLNVSIIITGYAQLGMKQLDYHNCSCGPFCHFSNFNAAPIPDLVSGRNVGLVPFV